MFLQKYISNENRLLKNIIENELDSILCSNEINVNKNINNIISQQKRKIHSTKTLNLQSLRNIFKNENLNLKTRFNELVKDEESYEIGSNTLKSSIKKFFKKYFRLKESENEDTIEKQI